MTHQVPLVLLFVIGMAGDSYSKTLPADVARNKRHRKWDSDMPACTHRIVLRCFDSDHQALSDSCDNKASDSGDSTANQLPTALAPLSADVARNIRHAYRNYDGAKRACSCHEIYCSYLSAEALALRELLPGNSGYPCRYLGCTHCDVQPLRYTTGEGADRHMQVVHGYQTGHPMLYNNAPAPPSPVCVFATTPQYRFNPYSVFATMPTSTRTRSKRRRK
jgi:hypothetical protein